MYTTGFSEEKHAMILEENSAALTMREEPSWRNQFMLEVTELVNV